MKHTLELQENLWVKQAEVVEILTEGGAVSGVVTHTGAVYGVKAAVIATGTYLGGAPSWARWSGLRAGRPGRRPAPDPVPGRSGGCPSAVSRLDAPPG